MAVTDPVMVDDPLPARCGVREMCRIFGIGPSQFHRLERRGKFERFELRPQIGRKAWSGALLEKYLRCEAGASRFVALAGRKSIVG